MKQLLLVYMYPVVNIFGLTVGSYYICSVIGILFCVFVGFNLIKDKKEVFVEDVIISAVYIVIGIVIGGHIVYAVTNIPRIISLFQNAGSYEVIPFIETLGSYVGGMVFYGGFLGGLIALRLFCRFSKDAHPDVMYDMYAVCIPLFHFFGRIGCFLGGCCYGVESEFGFTVHGNTLNPSVNDVNRFPVQLVEAVCNLTIFFILFILHRKKMFRQRLLIVYFFTYPVVRFILEFFRGDEIRGFLFGLSTSQIISILLFVFAVIFTAFDLKRNAKETKASTT